MLGGSFQKDLPTDRELEEVNHSSLKVQEKDALIWKDDRRGKYGVKSYYSSLGTGNNLLVPNQEI